MIEHLLHAQSIRKSFGGVHALRGVNFQLRSGEVHALIGENGAGKSTLVKVITGALTPDAGTLQVGSTNVTHFSPANSQSLGVACVYQQPALFPHLSVAENIALHLERHTPFTRIDWKARHRRAQEILQQVGAAIDAGQEAGTLTMPQQQLVEIAKAIGAEARILILDEPTACLSDREAEALFALIATLKSRGTGLIYITHRLEELPRIADRVTVLRDGESLEPLPMAGTSRDQLIRLMVNRPLSDVFPKQQITPGPMRLELRNLCCVATGIRNVNLTVRAGEIVGLAGLVGSGRTELANVLFGITPATSGEILVEGASQAINAPEVALRLGFGYVHEDRKRVGVVGPMSVAHNITLSSLNDVSSNSFIQFPREQQLAATFRDRLAVKTDTLDSPVDSLSGGNQQKVALAKWLATKPRIMILDEPTQGIDVGAKGEVHRLISEMAAQGLGVLLISSELPEILGMSDRIAVMSHGTIAGTLIREEATPEKLLAIALGAARS